MTSDRAGPIRLVADAKDPTVEIFFIGPDLELVARGVERLEASLRPGIYKVKFKASTLGGSVEEEQFVVLEAGKLPPVVTPTPHALDISSPSPIDTTRTKHEYHMYNAAKFSRKVHVTLGAGSRLLVFVRDLQRARTDNPLRGLTLHALDSDAVLVDLEKHGESITDGDWGFKLGEGDFAAGCNIELSPACYRLRASATPAGSFESAIVTSTDWQSMVFLVRRAGTSVDGAEALYPDLQNASLQMVRVGSGFNPGADDVKLTEAARYALVEARESIGQGRLGQMLDGKFDNPLLGLYGAHILLLAKEKNLSLLHIVVGNLRNLIGAVHPDVMALELRLAQLEGKPIDAFRFDAAPMLMRSWRIIRGAAAQSENIVPGKSFLARLSGCEMGDTMWLTWDADALRARAGKGAALANTFILAALASMFEGTRGSVDELLDRAGLDPIERELLARALKKLRSAGESPDYFRNLRANTDKGASGGAVESVGVLGSIGKIFFSPKPRPEADLRARIGQVLQSESLKDLGVPMSTVRLGVQGLLDKLS